MYKRVLVFQVAKSTTTTIEFGNPKENTYEICEEYGFSTRFTWISLYRVRHHVPIEQNMCIVLKVQQ